jgi:hypothetical protein
MAAEGGWPTFPMESFHLASALASFAAILRRGPTRLRERSLMDSLTSMDRLRGIEADIDETTPALERGENEHE